MKDETVNKLPLERKVVKSCMECDVLHHQNKSTGIFEDEILMNQQFIDEKHDAHGENKETYVLFTLVSRE